jgi:DNA-binding CsgD family transcriptional regulator
MKLTQNEKLREVLKDPKYAKIIPSEFLNELLEKPQIPNYYPVGTTTFFIYYVTLQKFIYLDDNFESIYHLSSAEMTEKDTFELFSNIIEFSQIEAVSEIVAKSYEICKKYKDTKNFSVSFEHNIRTKKKEKKRVLCQFTPLITNDDGYPSLSSGYITDITHLKKDGLPNLYVIVENQLVYAEETKPEMIIKNKHIPFTKRQVEILKLMSSGYSAKEVAQNLDLSVATIYTQTKLIKNKTGMDVKSAMKYLENKGLL